MSMCIRDVSHVELIHDDVDGRVGKKATGLLSIVTKVLTLLISTM